MSFLQASHNNARFVANRVTQSKFQSTPDFAEGFQLGWEETKQIELFTSRQRNRREFQQPMIDQINEMIDRGEMTRAELDQFRTRQIGTRKVMDWSAASEYINDRHGTDFDFSEETMIARINADTAERQERLQAAGMGATVGSFLGTLGSYATDPVELSIAVASAPLGGTPVAGRTTGAVLSTAGRIAMREAGINMGFEVLNQANIYHYKQYLGQEYRLSDAAQNLLVAGVLGGVVGSAIGTPVAIRRRAMNDARLADFRATTEASIQILERQLAETTPELAPVTRRVEGAPVPTRPIQGPSMPLEVRVERLRQQYTEQIFELAQNKIPRGEVKRLNTRLRSLNDQLARAEKAVDKGTATQVAARRAKRVTLRQEINRVQGILDANTRAREAEAELSRIRQGLTPPELQRAVDALPRGAESLGEDLPFVGPRMPETEEVMGPPRPVREVQLRQAQTEELRILKEHRAYMEKLGDSGEYLSAKEVAQALDEITSRMREGRNQATGPAMDMVARSQGQPTVKFTPEEPEAQFRQVMPDDTPVLDAEGVPGQTLGEALADVRTKGEEDLAKAQAFLECMLNVAS